MYRGITKLNNKYIYRHENVLFHLCLMGLRVLEQNIDNIYIYICACMYACVALCSESFESTYSIPNHFIA